MTNNYLINAIKNLEKENISPDDITNFVFELKVSNLLIPVSEVNDELTFETLISQDGELVLLPLFTCEDEFYKIYGDEDDVEPMENEFELYAEIISDESIDGIVIDAGTLSATVPKDMVEFAEADFAISYDDVETRSLKEIKDVYDNPQNEDLIKFIEDESNENDFEGLMVEMSNADLLNLVVSDESLDGFADGGAINADDVEGFSLFAIDDGDAVYGVLFTGKDAMLKAIPEGDDFAYYGQLTNVSELFNFVLRNDMDGVIINPNSNDFVIPRSAFLSQASGIEVVVEDKSFRNCLDYAFEL